MKDKDLKFNFKEVESRIKQINKMCIDFEKANNKNLKQISLCINFLIDFTDQSIKAFDCINSNYKNSDNNLEVIDKRLKKLEVKKLNSI